ncbi:MAG: hypothetical protein IPI06_00050 [Gammaproteobacteria bacterium]|nr:hypothetical protein [Gammaproteobacteria bacterium]
MKRGPTLRVSTADKVDFLRRPASYGDGGRRVALIETHFAWVFLTRRHAWKLKKPLRHWPLDHRSLASRRRSCQAELELNRRLAPSIYLDVVALTVNRRGGLRLGGAGRVVDWLVKMRRLPAARMLDRALQVGRVRDADVEAVVRLLAGFYARARRIPGGPEAYLRRLRGRIAANRRALCARDLHLDAARVRAVTAGQLDVLAAASGLLRARAGRLVEGHGDLRPEHVFIGRPVCVIDCLEFSAGLRTFDPLEELAFLAIECERLGAPRVAGSLLQHYRRLSGDEAPEALAQLYMSQRAATRAKISAWRLRDRQILDSGRWRERVAQYLAQAAFHLRLARAALAADPEGSAQGPVREERRERFARRHAAQCLSEQRRDG